MKILCYKLSKRGMDAEAEAVILASRILGGIAIKKNYILTGAEAAKAALKSTASASLIRN